MEDLPPGFRFYPTEEELVGFYLHNQLQGQMHHHINRVIPIIDINGKEPWDLPSNPLLMTYSFLMQLIHFFMHDIILMTFRIYIVSN
jgi:hypothetical protein